MRQSYKVAKKLYESKGKKLTPEEREAQRRSFAYGNTRIENDLITRELVDKAAEELKGKQDNNPSEG